ncbi:hypothetical protein CPB86DRAFT_389489 [Serendipita vermifera]|nr:hypothetical protein CPB86DRAFT_389489 [Serendipita vermifera]
MPVVMDPMTAMGSLTADIISHPAITQTRNAQKNRNFKDALGTLQVVQYGPDPLDVANVYINHDPTSAFYKPTFYKFTLRCLLLLDMKFLFVLRFTESSLSKKYNEVKDAKTYYTFLEDIRKEVEAICKKSGLQTLLESEITRYKRTEAGYASLSNLRPKNNTEAEIPTKTYKGKGLPRDHGQTIRGAPKSQQRKDHLEELVADDEVAAMLGKPPSALEGQTAHQPALCRTLFDDQGRPLPHEICPRLWDDARSPSSQGERRETTQPI